MTFGLIIAVLSGWEPGYLAVMALSGWQVIHFSFWKGFGAFPTHVRWFYFLITLTGLVPEIRLYMYIALLLGITMVTFFNRCILARILIMMPWNKGGVLV